MKQYIHNPDIYRRHYKAQVGRALPGFSGSRMQHGDGLGTFLGSIARKALPLISAGLKVARPHIKKAAKGVAKDLTSQATAMAMKKFTSGKVKHRTKRHKQKHAIKRKKGKGIRSKDIF